MTRLSEFINKFPKQTHNQPMIIFKMYDSINNANYCRFYETADHCVTEMQPLIGKCHLL